jgi:hypothetical protein
MKLDGTHDALLGEIYNLLLGESDEDSDSESEDTLNNTNTMITAEVHAEYNTPVSTKQAPTSVIDHNVPAAVSARRREKFE